MNNFEKIKAMDIDEMARWFATSKIHSEILRIIMYDTVRFGYTFDQEMEQKIKTFKQWLESEVRE